MRMKHHYSYNPTAVIIRDHGSSTHLLLLRRRMMRMGPCLTMIIFSKSGRKQLNPAANYQLIMFGTLPDDD
ncbi:hypothetical protein CTI12_AA150360 [Artemisia annua]|uniref:Uncharacterized protein n=1 Tax=Artemisia annua TaxID=35608 RepID=A0A2U1ND72_ARTAN|nr:hypothetical protein CTI12_AA150360 [Artemisia annua]